MNDSMIYLVMTFLIALAMVAFWRLLLVLAFVSFVAVVMYGMIMLGQAMEHLT